MEGLKCSKSTGKCAPAPGPGSPCESFLDCPDMCVDGVCVAPEPFLCKTADLPWL